MRANIRINPTSKPSISQFKNVNNKFSVDYYVNLELTDSEQRKFFKRMEICLTRLDESYYYEYRKAHEKDKFKSTVKREKSNFFGK